MEDILKTSDVTIICDGQKVGNVHSILIEFDSSMVLGHVTFVQKFEENNNKKIIKFSRTLKDISIGYLGERRKVSLHCTTTKGDKIITSFEEVS